MRRTVPPEIKRRHYRARPSRGRSRRPTARDSSSRAAGGQGGSGGRWRASGAFTTDVGGEWRHLDTMQYRTLVWAEVPRVRCVEHGGGKQVRVPWAEAQSRRTALFRGDGDRLAEGGEFRGGGAAMPVELGPDGRNPGMGGSAGLSRRPVAAAPAVGVDETSFQRRHEYVTIILPANLSIDDSRVQFELTRYLPDNWVPVPSRDVDGQSALPHRLDAEVANLGKFSACRRVARNRLSRIGAGGGSGAAAGSRTGASSSAASCRANRPRSSGMPCGGWPAAATYLYQDGPRYWYDTRPTRHQAGRGPRRAVATRPGPRGAGHRRPAAGRPERDRRVQPHPHRTTVRPRSPGRAGDPSSRARHRASVSPGPRIRGGDGAILESRGTTPRLYRNTLVFLAPDQTRLQDLDEAVRHHLAWESILAEREVLDRSPHQVRQAETQRDAAAEAVTARLTRSPGTRRG